MGQLRLFGLLSLLLLGCSAGSHWVVRHPAFPSGTPSREMLFPELGDRWVLVRAAWFAQQMHINDAQVYDSVGTRIRRSFGLAMEQNFPELSAAPAGIYDSFPSPESQRLDTKAYFKGRFPAQGQEVRLHNLAPPMLLLVHELTLGPDLAREKLYGLDQATLDDNGKPRKIHKLCAMASWTLWDNQRQRFLVSGVAEVKRPWNQEEGPAMTALNDSLLADLAAQIRCQMEGKCP
ncbi:MAG TPA: hypothetical protein VLM37_07930 [Fibrobacteraceae bacterium]|nr:hypothetical protein [Fibrobacteraceae bacterium]